MPALICKRPFSELLRTTQVESEMRQVWQLKGFEDSLAAEAALMLSPLVEPSLISNAGRTMPLVDITLRETGDQFIHQGAIGAGEGPMMYEATITYSTRGREVGQSRWTIAHPSQQKHIDYALERVAKSPNAPDHNGAINVKRTSDGFEIQGVDLPPPGDYTISIERSYPAGYVTVQTLAEVLRLRHTVNFNQFGSFAKGEVCFAGAEFRNELSELADIVVYQFEISANTAPFNIFGHQVPIKYGWDYFWVSVAEGTAQSQAVSKIDGWYLDRIMPFTDWFALEALVPAI